MKKLILTIILAVTTAFAFSQSAIFGVKAGIDLSNQTGAPYGGNKIIPGFNVGAIADIGFHDLSIQPGIFMSNKGRKDVVNVVNNDGMPAGTLSTSITLNYIEVPVNLLYHVTAAPGVRVYFGGGPYVAYGLGGTLSGYPVTNDYVNEPINFKNEPNANIVSYKNPDIGINLLGGVIIHKQYSIDAGYGLELNSISAGPTAIKNRVIRISLGYFFK